jgi:sugar O-acyltransferase (sialic acid O-acetyltransferase NeuD family)
MSKKQIIVVGGGGHAKQVLCTLLRMPEYEVIGFLDDNTSKTELFGIPRIGPLFRVTDELPSRLLALGIGHVGRVDFQKRVVQEYTAAGYSFETIISPTAVVVPYGVSIGEGTYIADNAIIEPDARIGNYSIINNAACINHDSVIGNHVHVAPGSIVSGNVTVGHEVLLGTGSAVIQGMTIADGSIVGAGAAVVSNLTEAGIYVGVPAKLIKRRDI